nr:beta-ketoacyl synthase N-terminal-like domain-containing protein [Lichenicoccus roseus]
MALQSGMKVETPAFAVNRLCGSGLQAVVSAAQGIMPGDAEIAVAGGAEVMSRIPYTVPAARFGARMGDTKSIDSMVALPTDPFDTIHTG